MVDNDIQSMACDASLEIDDLTLGIGSTLESLKKLARAIKLSIKQVDVGSISNEMISNLDPSTVVAVNRAFLDSSIVSPINSIRDFLQGTESLTSMLNEVILNPISIRETKPKLLHDLRSFCIALSIRASEHEASIFETQNINMELS